MEYKRYYLSAQIDLSAIVHNCKILRQVIPPRCKLCAVVKCNAYGHGVEVVLPALKTAEVEMLCVATIAEARQVQELGWEGPILLLGAEFSIYSEKEKEELARWIVESGLRITVTNKKDVDVLSAAAESLKKPAVVHVKLDTGMTRMGISEEPLCELIRQIRGNKNIIIEGLYTHFAAADEKDKSFTNYQLQRLTKFIKQLQTNGIEIPIIHCANSAAVLDLHESHFNMIRPGISICGCFPSPEVHNRPDLKPAMKVVSYLTLVRKIPAGTYIGYGCTYRASKDMVVGLVPIGYGDGYDRRLANIGKMTVAGHIVPVVGRISMDLTTIDLSVPLDKGCKLSASDEVIIIDNVRSAPNSVESIAAEIQTTPYELLTQLGARIVRVAAGPAPVGA